MIRTHTLRRLSEWYIHHFGRLLFVCAGNRCYDRGILLCIFQSCHAANGGEDANKRTACVVSLCSGKPRHRFWGFFVFVISSVMCKISLSM